MNISRYAWIYSLLDFYLITVRRYIIGRKKWERHHSSTFIGKSSLSDRNRLFVGTIRLKYILTRKKQSKLWKEEPKMIEWIPNKELPY